MIPYFGSGVLPAFKSDTTIFWLGIIIKKTFAVINVAVIAPKCKNAALPLKIDV